MRTHDAGARQLIIEACASAMAVTPRHYDPALASSGRADHNVYGEDFALVRVRDGFYADEHRRIFYASRGRVFLLRSPRMRPGQGFRRIAALPQGAVPVDETQFSADDPGDQALFTVADCIDRID